MLTVFWVAFAVTLADSLNLVYYLVSGPYDFNLLGTRVYLADFEKPGYILLLSFIATALTAPGKFFGNLRAEAWAWICAGFHDSIRRLRSAGESARPRLHLYALALVLIAGVIFRIWGLYFPDDHVDSYKQINAAISYLDWNYTFEKDIEIPAVRGYPYFAMHLLEWTFRGYSVFRDGLGGGGSWISNSGDLRAALSLFQRWLNVLYQAVSILAIYAIGARLFDRWAGVAASAAVAFSTVNVQMTHFVNADVVMFMFFTLSMYFATGVEERGPYHRYFMTGLMAGFSAAAKYNGVFALGFAGLVFLARRRSERPFTLQIGKNVNRLALLGAGGALAFLVGTPALLIEPWKYIHAIQECMNFSAGVWAPQKYLERRFAMLLYLAPGHFDKFIRFFEPVTGWTALGATAFFVYKRGLSMAYLWIFSIVAFVFGAYSMPISSSYHFLGALAPLYLVIGCAVVDVARSLKTPLAKGAGWAVGSAAAGWVILALASDTSLFTLPDSSRRLMFNYIADMPATELLASARYKRDIPNARDVRPKDAYPIVAEFALEKRYPSLSNSRHVSEFVAWKDRKPHDAILFPHIYRPVGVVKDFLFPANIHFSRYTGFFKLKPGLSYTRYIKQPGEPLLLYALNLSDKPAKLTVTAPDFTREITLSGRGEQYIEFNPGHSWKYEGLVAETVFKSDKPVVVWMGAGEDRAWFLALMERWSELAVYEKGREGWKSRLRALVAGRMTGGKGDAKTAADIVRRNMPGAIEGVPLASAYSTWTNGAGLELFDAPEPELFGSMFDSFYISEQGGEKRFHNIESQSDGYVYLKPDGLMFGPYTTLSPGFYRARFLARSAVSENCPQGRIIIRVTSEEGALVLAETSAPLSGCRAEVTVPFRVNASKPGWDTELTVQNATGGPLQVENVRLENDTSAQLAWWMGLVRDTTRVPELK
jgi:hypothetical protein